MNSKDELKAGHRPAVRAGKMRITQHKSQHDNTHSNAVCEDSNLKLSASPPKFTAVSGAPVHGHCDFPPEAVQKFHDKPLPTHEQKCNFQKPVIHQPKK